MLILDGYSKIKAADHMDQIISAEIPDEAVDPELHSTVITCMIHNPCHKDKSSSCLENGKCTMMAGLLLSKALNAIKGEFIFHH